MDKLGLLRLLWSLEPTGGQGFEGLILNLLQALLGTSFDRAKGGYQQGSDMATRTMFPKMAAECKRYEKKELDDRELLGEIAEAQQSNPNLDVWILASTKKVDCSLLTKLQTEAFNRSIGLVVLDEDKVNSAPGRIVSLCCEFPAITKAFISEPGPMNSFAAFAETVRKGESHAAALDALRVEIHEAIQGLDAAQMRQFLIQRFELTERRNFIKQTIWPRSAVDRPSLSNQLCRWLDSKPEAVAVVTGEEGLGKTWGVAKWVYQLITEGEVPVLFATSSEIADMTAPEDVLTTMLQNQTPSGTYRTADFWKRKISYWAKAESPRLIVVLDGVNEWTDMHNAGKLIKKWTEVEYNKFAHLLITCREYHWQEVLRSYVEQGILITVGALDDSELESFLQVYRLSIQDLPSSIRSIVRRPRYLHLAVELREKLRGCRDITPAHLVYYDLEHKYEQNLITGEHLGLDDHRDFSRLLKRIVADSPASDTLGFCPTISPDSLRESLQSYVGDNWQRTRREMLSMDIIRETGEGYILEQRYLVHYIGKMIYDTAKGLDERRDLEFDDCFAGLFEPYAGFDLKEECLAHSVFWAVMDQNQKHNTMRRLFDKWMSSQQFIRWEEVAAFLPAIQNAVFDIIDSRDYFPHDIEMGFTWLLSIIADGSQDVPSDALVERINRWLSAASEECRLREPSLPMLIDNGIGRIGPYQYAVKTNRIVQAPRFAFSVLSQRPFRSCINGLIAHALLQESGHCPIGRDALQWIASTAFRQILKEEIPARLNSLIGSGLEEGVLTVIGLLRLAYYLGESELGTAISRLPDNIAEHDIRWNKHLACSTCWNEDSAATCRRYALSGAPDSRLHLEARRTCVRKRDKEILDSVIEAAKEEPGRIYDTDVRPLWESGHEEWLRAYFDLDDLKSRVVSQGTSVNFPCTLRPSTYAMGCVSGLLSGKSPEEIFHALCRTDKAVWGNGDVGVLNDSFRSKEMAQSLSVLREGKLHEYIGHTLLDSNWEAIAPLFYHSDPSSAAEFIRFQMGLLKEYKNREVFVRVLAEGAGAVASDNEYCVVDEVCRKIMEDTTNEHEWRKADALKLAILASPSLETAKATLLDAPYSVTQWDAINPVWRVVADEAFFEAIVDGIRHSEGETLLGCMWKLFHVGSVNKGKACAVACEQFLGSSDECIKYVASAILGWHGDQKAAEFLWDRIEDVTRATGGKWPYYAGVFAIHNYFLKNVPVAKLLRVLPVRLVNYLLAQWDDEARADEFADAIDCLVDAILSRNELGLSELATPCYTLKGLEYLWKYRKRRVQRWVDRALNDTYHDAFKIASLYWEIAALLVHVEPEASTRIAGLGLQSFSGNRTWQTELCSKNVPKSIRAYREECMFNACNSADIYEWALAFRYAENDDWEWAIQYLNDHDPLKRAIAVQLLGWSGQDCEGVIHQLANDDRNCYVRSCAAKADEDWWREHWAKKWYAQMCHSKTVEDTWAAQELFKLVADARALTWRGITADMIQNCNWKQRLIIHSTQDHLREYGKRYAEAQKEVFFGQRVMDIVRTTIRK